MKILMFYPGHGMLSEPEPLGLECLAAMVPWCDVHIVDLRFDKESPQRAIERIKPRVVAVTATTMCVYQAQDVLQTAKRVDPEIFTVVGGSHASSWPGDFNLPFVDAIVLGLGEVAFRELIETLSNGGDLGAIQGLVLPDPQTAPHGPPRTTPARPIKCDLDALPHPRRDLTRKYRHRYRYYMGRNPMALISTSRGCPNRCSFCAIWRLMQGRYLARSPDNVVTELASLDQKVVRFADGNTFGDVKRVHAIADELLATGVRKLIMMDVSTDIVIRQPDLIEKLRKAGLFSVVVGIESVKDEKLHKIRKKSTVADHVEAIRILHNNGIRVAGSFIADHDFTDEDFDRMEAFIFDNRIDYPLLNVQTPLPGTLLFEQCQDEILSFNYDHFDLRHPVLPTRMARDHWWKSFRRLDKKCIFKMLDNMTPVTSFLAKRAASCLLWKKTRNNHKLTTPGREGTRLHRIVSGRQTEADRRAREQRPLRSTSAR